MKTFTTILTSNIKDALDRVTPVLEKLGHKGEIISHKNPVDMLQGEDGGVIMIEWPAETEQNLDFLCAAVDGRIEVYSYMGGLEDPFLYGNEEARDLELPHNPFVPPAQRDNGEYPLCGDMVLVKGTADGSSHSLTKKEIFAVLSNFSCIMTRKIKVSDPYGNLFQEDEKQDKLETAQDGNKDAENGGGSSTPDA